MSADVNSPLFERLGLPDTELARGAHAYAAELLPPVILNHSIRSFAFARAHAEHDGLRPDHDYDEELLFLGCILHDIGVSDAGNGEQRFEVDGADLAAAFLREHGVEERRVKIAWDAIALHTSDGICHRKSPEAALGQAGIGTDILGRFREQLPAGFADDLHALLPRENLAYALSDAILAQARDKPHKANPLTFPGQVLSYHLPQGAFPGWYDAIANSGWGDKPITTGPRRPQSPQQAAEMFMEYLDKGDYEGLASLYEPNAHFVPQPGVHLDGSDAIRPALRQMVESGAKLKLELREIRIANDIALLSNNATLTGAGPEPVITISTEVLRRQPDGTWSYVIDDPFFS